MKPRSGLTLTPAMIVLTVTVLTGCVSAGHPAPIPEQNERNTAELRQDVPAVHLLMASSCGPHMLSFPALAQSPAMIADLPQSDTGLRQGQVIGNRAEEDGHGGH